MTEDGPSQLRAALQQRNPGLRVAHAAQPDQRMIQGPRGPEMYYAPPPPPRLSFGQIALRVIPILAAVMSTGLLAYFILFGQRSEPSLQAQQPLAPMQPNGALPMGQMQPAQQAMQPQFAQNAAQAQGPQDAPAPPDVPAGPPLGIPADEVLILMMRSTVLALNQANLTGNYSVFRQLGSPAFQRNNSSEHIAAAFAKLRARNIDLTPILLLMPKMYKAPEITQRGMLRLNGFFPSQPDRVNFDLLFQQVGNKWKLYGAAVDAIRPKPAQPQAAAPTPQPQPVQQAAPKAAKPAPVQAAKPAAKPKAEADVRDRVDEVDQETGTPVPAPTEAPAAGDNFNPFSR